MGMGVGSSSNRSRRHGGRSISEINVTPMVDVMLVLLIIFMVTAPMLTAGVNVDLPDAAAAPLPGTDEPLTISVGGDGRIYLQETPMELRQLVTKLKAITKAKMDTRIFVRGDRRVDYGRVMQIMGAMNEAGFSKVALITEQAPASTVQSSQ